jgi:hypothetical protein
MIFLRHNMMIIGRPPSLHPHPAKITKCGCRTGKHETDLRLTGPALALPGARHDMGAGEHDIVETINTAAWLDAPAATARRQRARTGPPRGRNRVCATQKRVECVGDHEIPQVGGVRDHVIPHPAIT